MLLASAGLLLFSAHAALAGEPVSAPFPLGFERNDGQAGSSVLFLARGPSFTTLLTRTGVVFRSAESTLQMTFDGANPEPGVVPQEPLPGSIHYLVGAPEHWR